MNEVEGKVENNKITDPNFETLNKELLRHLHKTST
jgi:hypothetical protein